MDAANPVFSIFRKVQALDLRAQRYWMDRGLSKNFDLKSARFI
jgi:hypothetical protein